MVLYETLSTILFNSNGVQPVMSVFQINHTRKLACNLPNVVHTQSLFALDTTTKFNLQIISMPWSWPQIFLRLRYYHTHCNIPLPQVNLPLQNTMLWFINSDYSLSPVSLMNIAYISWSVMQHGKGFTRRNIIWYGPYMQQGNKQFEMMCH